MSDLRQLFFETAGELVQKLNDEAMQLEKSPGDAETARSLRRTVHTLKGDSAACGFRELSELSHEFEDVLALENTAAAASVPEIALRAADVFAALLEAYRTGTQLPNLQSLRADIARLAHPEAESAVAAATKTSNKKPGKTKIRTATNQVRWSEYERLAIARAVAEGKRIHHVLVEIDPECAMPIAGRQMIQLALASLGEVLALYPAEGSLDPIKQIEAALVSERPAEQIRAKCSIPTVALNVKVKPLRAAAPLPPLEQASAAVSEGTALEGKEKDKAALPASAEGARGDTAVSSPNGNDAPAIAETAPAVASGPDNLLRVDAEKIDSVLNLVGELILAKSMLQQTLLEFGERFPKDALRGKFADAMAFQGRVLNDLQHSVMKIRMVPVDQLFRRFPRIVRDVGRQCGKEVELLVRGGQTDLDKSILDAIGEPMTHLVRNAISHGIESAEERVSAGKRAQGTLRLSAYHQGNQVVIEVSDDGRGIDTEKVKQRALAQGLLDAGQADRLTEAETLELILRPGFSTAEEITEISGRGVGLDVVQSVLGHLKGTVQIETGRGRGTTFRMRLPLTLAIIRALLFRVEQRIYALPLNAVAEIARAVEENIHQVEHYEVLQLRNDVLPLLRLGARPAGGPETARSKVFVLVINSGERKFGVVVDGMEGEDELVIKALDDQSIATDLVSGASILGDGRVVLILNMIALMERFTRGRTDASGTGMAGLLSNLADVEGSGVELETAAARARGAAGGQK
jgi:two-component system chemotaxis sensor kinase CheA